jgi:hypothetical protein
VSTVADNLSDVAPISANVSGRGSPTEPTVGGDDGGSLLNGDDTCDSGADRQTPMKIIDVRDGHDTSAQATTQMSPTVGTETQETVNMLVTTTEPPVTATVGAQSSTIASTTGGDDEDVPSETSGVCARTLFCHTIL